MFMTLKIIIYSRFSTLQHTLLPKVLPTMCFCDVSFFQEGILVSSWDWLKDESPVNPGNKHLYSHFFHVFILKSHDRCNWFLPKTKITSRFFSTTSHYWKSSLYIIRDDEKIEHFMLILGCIASETLTILELPQRQQCKDGKEVNQLGNYNFITISMSSNLKVHGLNSSNSSKQRGSTLFSGQEPTKSPKTLPLWCHTICDTKEK